MSYHSGSYANKYQVEVQVPEDTTGMCIHLNAALRNCFNTSDCGREPLPNYFLRSDATNSSFSHQYYEANIIYVHLPKAGGTSVEQLFTKLSSKTRKVRTRAIYHCQDLFKEGIISRKISTQTVYISKRTYGMHDYVYTNRPVAYVTWFREPIERLVSCYYYLKKTNCAGSHVICKKYLKNTSSLTQYLKHNIRLQDMSNLMVRLLQFGDFPEIDDTFEDCCGSVSLSEVNNIPEVEEKHYLVAKRNLETKMAFIGLTEDFKTSQDMLSYMFGIPQEKNIVHVNANKHSDSITDYEMSELRKRNKWDLKLYDDAKSIYMKQKSRYLTSVRKHL
ncbi:uncharacterized protein LOC144344981 [Saccoglossus kowalevskii]